MRGGTNQTHHTQGEVPLSAATSPPSFDLATEDGSSVIASFRRLLLLARTAPTRHRSSSHSTLDALAALHRGAWTDRNGWRIVWGGGWFVWRTGGANCNTRWRCPWGQQRIGPKQHKNIDYGPALTHPNKFRGQPWTLLKQKCQAFAYNKTQQPLRRF